MNIEEQVEKLVLEDAGKYMGNRSLINTSELARIIKDERLGAVRKIERAIWASVGLSMGMDEAQKRLDAGAKDFGEDMKSLVIQAIKISLKTLDHTEALETGCQQSAFNKKP